jgi:photosystem II stability/assembly factor-like uncharacterized protein
VDYGDPLAATRAGLAVERPTATIAVSIDSEKSFTELQALNDRLTFLAIFVDRQGTIHAFDSLDGHWTSRDGGRYWSLMKQKRSYYVNPDVPPYAGIDGKIYMPTTRVVGTMNFHEVLVSSDNGATFHPMPHPSVAGAKNYNVYPTGTGELYSYSDTHTISHTTDDGTTWQDMMVLKDSTFPFLPTAPAQIVGFVKQGSLLWMASENSIYHTTDDGKFWVPTQGLTGQNFRWGSFTSLWGARSKSIIAPMQSAGKFWLSVNEKYSNDSYIWCYGPVVQVDDSDVIGYMTYRSSPFYEDELIRMHRGHDLFDTLDRGPDTLAIRGMAYDSSGNLLGIGYPSTYSHGSMAMRGIYKFYPTGSRVPQRTLPSNDLDVYVKDGRLEVSLASPQTIVELRIVNVLGELVAADHSILSGWTSPHLNPGLYIIQVRTQTSSMVRKIVIP